MGVSSGKFAVINGVTGVRQWSINETEATNKVVASHTVGGTARTGGVGSWTGSFNAFGHSPLWLPGQLVSFLGYIAPSSGVFGTIGPTRNGQAMVNSVVITWNFKTGELISHVVNFEGHLALTTGTGTHMDIATPDYPPLCGVKISTFDGTDRTEIPNITQATFTLTSANTAYTNSSTGCTTGRKDGPLDWTLALALEQPEKPLDIGSDHIIHLGVDPADEDLVWELKWGKVKEYTGLQVNRETGEIVAQTLNIEMNGFVDGVLGQIVQPDLTVVWPPEPPAP
jgi:hypothetical protein